MGGWSVLWSVVSRRGRIDGALKLPLRAVESS
jgi:hypothetical protein